MQSTTQSWPFYARLCLILICIYLLLYGIYLGQDILLPFGFAFLLAVLVRPIEAFLMRIKLPKVPAILLTIFISSIVFFALLTFITYMISSFMSDIPSLKRNLSRFLEQAQVWIADTFNFNRRQQQEVIEKAQQENANNLKTVATGTLGIVTASLVNLTLIPIYMFLFLYFRTHLLQFIVQVFDKRHTPKVVKALSEIRSVVQHYVRGLLIEMGVVAALNSIGLLLLGVPYAILLGVIGAVLNLIPYIGGLVAVILTGVITMANLGDPYIALGAIGVYLAVQFLDNNFLVPRIIGSSVKLNALFSIVAVLVGGAVAGVGGMFLSLPFLAILKVIFDHVDELKPWGMLLGDADLANWRFLRVPARRKPRRAQA
jgi:predicted PurR-regulated permease PerM